MIQQINNNSIRDTEMHESDIDFLRKFYVEHSHFPVFQQVLIETRTDCNNHCPFCPHAFNKNIGYYEMEMLYDHHRPTM